MLTEQRYEKILQELAKSGSVTVQDMMKELDASESTIRRDITALDKMGKLTKVFGGAVEKSSTFQMTDREVAEREDLNVKEKNEVAKYAASLIEEGDFVYLDTGTTTLRMVDYITVKDAVFVTNFITIAKKMSAMGKKIFLLGGEFKHKTEAIVGNEAVMNLRKYHFTKGFFGTNGITVAEGFTTPELNEAIVKQAAMEQCKEAYVVSDHTKFGRISPVTFGEFGNATIITDSYTAKGTKKYANIIETGRKN